MTVGIDPTLFRIPVRFVPVVHLSSRAVTGFEVSPRRPDGGPASVDQVQNQVLAAVATADLPTDLSWLVTVQSREAGRLAERARSFQVEAGRTPLKVVAELRDQDLDVDPGALFGLASAVRAQGWSLALDVGRNPDAIALLPLIEPDVVKVDLHAVEARIADETADVGYPIRAYAESAGAVVLAKGVDTERRLELAQLLGATFGQGTLLGRPGTLPRTLPRPWRCLHAAPRARDRLVRTPFHIVSDAYHPAMTTKRVLVRLSRQIEVQAAASGESHVCLGVFQHVDHWTPRVRRHFEALGRANLFTRVFATGMPAHPAPGVHGTDLAPHDRLTKEWALVVLGPKYAAALVALDLGDTDRADADHRFQYVITHDRALVTDVARDLLRRSGNPAL